MSFKYTWDESEPTGSSNSRKLHVYTKRVKRAIAERLEVQHIALDDPTVGATEDSLLYAQGRHEAGKVSVLGIYRTESDAPVSPPDGAIIYTRDDQKLKYYDDSQWKEVPLEIDIDDGQENFTCTDSVLDGDTVVGGGEVALAMLPAFISCSTAQLVSFSFNLKVLADDYHIRDAMYSISPYGEEKYERPDLIRLLPAYDIYFKLADATGDLSVEEFQNGIALKTFYNSSRDPELVLTSSLASDDKPWFTPATEAPPEDEDFGTYYFGGMLNCMDVYNFTKVMQVPAGIWAVVPLIYTARSVVVIDNSSIIIRGYKL